MKRLVRLNYLLLLIIAGTVNAQVPYVPTPTEVVEAMLDMAKVTKNDIVYDLGCGDGRIVVTAAKKYGARGMGFDLDEQRIKESNQNAKTNNVEGLVGFRQMNLFDADLSNASVVTLYLLSEVNLKLRPKLFKELKPGTRVVSHAFDMDEWEPDDKNIVNGRSIFYWRIPENYSGRWELTNTEKNSKYVVDLNQTFQQINGTIWINGEKADLSNSKTMDGKLLFTFKQGNEERKFEGVLNNDILEGMIAVNGSNIKYTGKRDPYTIKPLDPQLIDKSEL